MQRKCPNCGHELDEGVIVCGYCGHAIPSSDLDDIARQKLVSEKRSDESLKTDPELNIRALGVFLIGLGILSDIVSMFMINSGDYEIFNYLCIGGTISFLLGLILAFAFR